MSLLRRPRYPAAMRHAPRLLASLLLLAALLPCLPGCANGKVLGIGATDDGPQAATTDAEPSDYDYQPPDVTDAKARVAIHDQIEPKITVFNAAARWRAGELARVRVPARAVSEVGDLGAQYRFTFYDIRGTPIDDGSDWQWKRMPPNEPVYFEGASLGGGAADWYLEVRPTGLYPGMLSDATAEDPRDRAPNQLRREFQTGELRAPELERHGYLGPPIPPRAGGSKK